MANENDPIEDYVKELHAQFAQMHTELEGLQQSTTKVSTEQVTATHEQTEAVKEQTKVVKEQTKVVKDQTKIAKDSIKQSKVQTEQAKVVKDQTKIAKDSIKQSKVQTEQAKAQSATLKEMQRNLHRQQMQQGASMADVAAEHIAGGGGIGGAMKAAAGLKVAQFKHRFDPLNIIKKMTGGSRLAVALAGKVMGRKESTVREFADLAPAEEGGLPSSIFGKKSSFGAPTRMETGGVGGGAERVDGGKGGLLGKIADTLTKVLSRLTGIEVLLQADSKLSQDQLDALKDEASVENARKKPTRVGGLVSKAKDAGSDFMKFLTDMIGKIKFGLVAAFLGLVAAGVMLAKQWDNLKLSFSLLKDSAVDLWDGVKTAFSNAGTWISDTTNSIIDNIAEVFDNIIQGVQELLAKLPFGSAAPTKAERRATLETAAKGGSASAARRLAKQDAEAKATPEATGAVLAKLAPQFASKIPADGKVAAAETLKSGSLNAEVVGASGQLQAVTGSPEKVSTGAALTQLTAAAYEQTYGVSPGKDTNEGRKTRLPEMVAQASQALASVVASTGPAQVSQTPQVVASTGPAQVSQTPQVVASTGPAQVSQTPQTVTPATPGAPIMTATAPTVGMDLNSAAEARRNAEATGPAGIFAPMTNVNKTVNNNSATTINQGMAPTRSGEDTHVRARDLAYARS